MATKSNPGKFDCYEKAEPDEPMFVLLARDKHAPCLVWLWSVLRELDQENPEKVKEARQCVVDMMKWQSDRGKKVSGTGEAVLAGVLELIRGANYAIKQVDDVPNEPTGVELIRRILVETKFDELS